MNVRGRIPLVLLWCWAAVAGAAPEAPKPFVTGSMKDIAAAHTGRPFILAFWSLGCAPCEDNLDLFGRLLKRHPGLPLVLVSTDSPDKAEALGRVLQKHGQEGLPTWAFADHFVERLHFEIDRRWRGDLPRTYLYDARHQARTISGKLDEAETERWVRSLPAGQNGSATN